MSARSILYGAAAAAALALQLAGCCELLRVEADQLVDEARACTAGDECVVVSWGELGLGDSCVSSFQCSVAVNAQVDLDRFARRAASISDRWDGQCDTCTKASCVEPSSAACDVGAGRCELR